jgi:hypothetical protein
MMNDKQMYIILFVASLRFKRFLKDEKVVKLLKVFSEMKGV